ncbi:AMP-binding protein [Streptomyces sp. NPDC057302]|uniref:AMP-binding protein n=1 Tax=Streptomyces sp. NPDC057302 TaxID=3346094 RepID=UPI003645A08F
MHRTAYPQIPLDGLPRWAAVRDPDGAALTTESGTCTFAELDQQTDRVAHYIRRTARSADSVVGVVGAPSADFAAAYYGASRSGHTFAAIGPRLGKAPLHHIFTAAGIEIAFVPAATAALLSAVRGRLPRLHTVVVTGAGRRAAPAGTITLPSALEGTAHDPVVAGSDLDAVTCVRFHAGSTGLPQGVALTHRSLVTHARTAALAHRLGPQSVICNRLPDYGDTYLNPGVYAGASQVLCQEPGPAASLAAAARAAATHCFELPERTPCPPASTGADLDGELFAKPSRAT